MRADGEPSNTNGTSRPFPNGSGPYPLHKAAVSSSTNTNGKRRSPVAMNGSSSTNGYASANGRSILPYFGHDREEVTRIILQALGDMGYHGAAASLTQESGYELESPAIVAFRNAVLQGEWTEAEELLFGETAEEDGSSTNRNSLALQEGVDQNIMRFWLRQQKFLELLEQRDTGRALMVLRSELTPLYQDIGKLHFLSSLLMCQSTEDLKAKADWDGANGGSRHHLLSELARYISPSVMIPEHRLAILLQQVKQHQISSCLYHNTPTSPSLYQDHTCDRNGFPLQTILELGEHDGEVWQVQFSNDGTRLASCGSDGNVHIYDVPSFELLHTLEGHESGVCSLAWSPDDSMMVTCSQDRRARLWDTTRGEIKRTLNRFGEPVSSCAWAPDGQTFVTGCLDKERNLCQYSLSGDLIYDWRRSHRIQDLAVSPNGHRLVAMDNETHIHVYDFVTRELEYEIDMKVKMGSVSISQNSRWLLVEQKDGKARIVDLDTREPIRYFQSGDKGSEFIIRASFGGANESFVVSGSEGITESSLIDMKPMLMHISEGSIFIWRRENGQLIEKLEGHGKGCCSAVSWNPVNPCMFASAGDDCKVRIWSNEGPRSRSSKPPRQSNGSHPESNGWLQ
ncbi:WD40 repeat-like protein [Venustampulla echinocandica]|uniref:WD40 repeat-like protein n=1 Tax=Venustampulla echinocandica TaxID=2656787 RepID=A0A370TLJ4_9HELO|nr:WD40 repeat-like protein [Venustampulla echinocandica]RDL36385.1 WD40 repeat-like protein [Venustampulla echinocandica]